jgi:hypothetical protein
VACACTAVVADKPSRLESTKASMFFISGTPLNG